MRQAVDRLFLSLLTIAVVCISIFEPESLSFTIAQMGGRPAQICALVLGLLGGIALLDTVVNDMLPDRFVFRTAQHFRQGVWMWIAITHTGTAWVIVKVGVGYWLALLYFLFAARCAAASFIDLAHQQQLKTAERAKGQPHA